MLGKIIYLPSSTLLAAVAIQNANANLKSDKQETSDDLSHYHCKATDLPVYAPLHSCDKPHEKRHNAGNGPVRTGLESGVRAVRVQLQTVYNTFSKQKEALDDFVYQAKDKTLSTVDYLNEPHNLMPRTGAIAIGGLSGFIFAARGGFIKKVLYTMTGAGAVASLCYPKQAEQFSKEALFEARKGYAIAYNFVKGVKPGDDVPVEPISNFPTTLQDIKFIIYDFYDEVKQSLFPEKKG